MRSTARHRSGRWRAALIFSVSGPWLRPRSRRRQPRGHARPHRTPRPTEGPHGQSESTLSERIFLKASPLHGCSLLLTCGPARRRCLPSLLECLNTPRAAVAMAAGRAHMAGVPQGVHHAQIQHPRPSFFGDRTAVQLAVRAGPGRCAPACRCRARPSTRRAGDGGPALANHGYVAAAIRLSRTYW